MKRTVFEKIQLPDNVSARLVVDIIKREHLRDL